METPPSIGPFEVRRELGRGAGGVVYEAVEPTDGREAAVKLYTSAPRDATAAIARLRRDAQAAGALGHPNLAPVLAVGDHDGQPWVATEFVRGLSLAQVLRSRAPWPIERVLDIWRQLCEGLAHAHREGVLHLDLKPADVRVTAGGEVKLVDFGSWQLKALSLEGPGPADEGLHYRAPEVVLGRRPDRRADVFGVGVVVYELVARRRAFPGETATEVIRALSRAEPDLACLPGNAFSPGFERVLARSLARAVDGRHASFEEVHADLVQLVREAAPRLRSAAAPVPPEREERRAALTRARAEGKLEDALEIARALTDEDAADEAAQRALAELESALLENEVETLVGRALEFATDGELAQAATIAEKVERLAPWSPRYLQLQVYLDEEKARHAADALVSTAREHLGAGRDWEARAAAEDALAMLPDHGPARQLLQELPAAPPTALEEAAVEDPAAEPPAFDPAAEEPGAEEPPAAQSPADIESAVALRHLLSEEPEQARAAVTRALALDPEHPRALELRKILFEPAEPPL